MYKKTLVLCALLLLVGCETSKPIELLNDEITLEYGNSVSTNVEDYVAEEDVERCTLNMEQMTLSDGGYPAVGDYNIIVEAENDSKEVILHVVDTTSPELTLSNEQIEIFVEGEINIEEFVSYSDLSETNLAFDDASVDYNAPGKYKATVKVVDMHNNETSKEISVVVKEKSSSNKPSTTFSSSSSSNNQSISASSSNSSSSSKSPWDYAWGGWEPYQVYENGEPVIIVPSHPSTSEPAIGTISTYNRGDGWEWGTVVLTWKHSSGSWQPYYLEDMSSTMNMNSFCSDYVSGKEESYIAKPNYEGAEGEVYGNRVTLWVYVGDGPVYVKYEG